MERLMQRALRKTSNPLDDETRNEIRFNVRKLLLASKRICSDRHNQELHQTLDLLSKNPKIKVCRYDKDKSVAILDSHDCLSKLNAVVNDKSKFEVIKTDDISRLINTRKKSILRYSIFENI